MAVASYDWDMAHVIVAVVVVCVVLAVVLAVVAIRRQPPPPPRVAGSRDENPAERHARFAALNERGTELLERRVELDDRRGTLGGNTQIYDAFEELEARLRAGDISDDEFEREKVRLLGG
jgi:uncharacterized membrane protein